MVRYPLAAVIGQDRVKKALLLNSINPKIGGVLISGEKGTAKSTIVRGLADILYPKKIIDVPLNITEDNFIGTIDLEKTLVTGKKHRLSGILKKAYNNILYMDEVNLLPRNIINNLLESLSFNESSSLYNIIGTMNPEEGSLSSHFLDRFGIYVECKSSKDVSIRKDIIKAFLDYERNPYEFIKKYENQTQALRDKIIKAQKLLKDIPIEERHIQLAVKLAREANCEGHRGDIILIETAKAIAAYDLRKYVNIEDIKEAAEYVLVHRIREAQKPQPNNNNNSNANNNEENNNEQNNNTSNDSQNKNTNGTSSLDNEKEKNNDTKDENNDNNGLEFPIPNNEDDIQLPLDFDGVMSILDNIEQQSNKILKRIGTGKRLKTISNQSQGRYIKYRLPYKEIKDIAFDATIRMAVPFQKFRTRDHVAIAINKEDIRVKVRQRRAGASILFLVDASGSMGAYKRMSAVKGAIISMLTDAYQKRDKVGLIAFRGKKAEVLLNITRSVDLAKKSLVDLPTGGKTPLEEGLKRALYTINEEHHKDKNQKPILVIVSDGRANYTNGGGNPLNEALEVAKKIKSMGVHSIVIDTEKGFLKIGCGKKLAEVLGSHYYKLDELNEYMIKDIVKKNVYNFI